MTELVDVALRGITFGSLYGLVAISFNIIYRPTNVLNFAQGELVMLGAMVAAVLLGTGVLPWSGALLVAILACALLALLEERVAVAPVLRRSPHSTVWIISTLAFSIVVVDVAGKVWDQTPRLVPTPAGLSMIRQQWGPVGFTTYQVGLILLVIVITVGLQRFYRSRTGSAIKAVAEDRDAALLRGIDPNRLTRLSFILGGAVAAVAGVLAGPLLYASIDLGPALLLKGFAAAAIGGIGDVRGALLAGYVVGASEAVAATTLSPGLQESIVFAVLLLVLMIRPVGLFGSATARSV